MRCTVFSSKVGIGDLETAAAAGFSVAGPFAAAGGGAFGLAAGGAPAWANAVPAIAVARNSASDPPRVNAIPTRPTCRIPSLPNDAARRAAPTQRFKAIRGYGGLGGPHK